MYRRVSVSAIREKKSKTKEERDERKKRKKRDEIHIIFCGHGHGACTKVGQACSCLVESGPMPRQTVVGGRLVGAFFAD